MVGNGFRKETRVERGLPPVVVPSFDSGTEARRIEVLKANLCRRELPDMYPRDSYRSLLTLERPVAKLVGVSTDNLLLYANGMSAVISAIESASPKAGTVLLHGTAMYSRTLKYINGPLNGRGVVPVAVDSGNICAIEKAVEEHKPDIIIFEIVANGPGVPVLDIKRLLAAQHVKERRPRIILDNTVAGPSVMPSSSLLGHNGDNDLVVVESGTKFYTRNRELCGILYTHNRDLIRTLFDARITNGTAPSISTAATINGSIPASRSRFDSNNLRACRNALTLARACHRAQQENPSLMVHHPNLPNHSNKQLADQLAPEGITPIFCIAHSGFDGASAKHDAYELTDLIFRERGVKENFGITQSFGFDASQIYPYSSFPVIRISAGTESQKKIEPMAYALYRALARVR